MNNLKKYALPFAIIISFLIHFIVIKNISFNMFQSLDDSKEDIVITLVKSKKSSSTNNEKLFNSKENEIEDTIISSDKKIKKNISSTIEIQKQQEISQDNKQSNLKTIDTSEVLAQISKFNYINESEDFTKNQRIKSISSKTTDYIYRLYFEAWRQKVEQIGAMNYPKEASEMGMFGSLRLTVVIDSEGMIRKLNINKSSGHKELDEAAMHIVKLGEPYARFPSKILKEVDLISITRKWKFTEQDNFYSQ
ncbi:MAG: energy transducer TonB [Methylophilaceae bacterium]